MTRTITHLEPIAPAAVALAAGLHVSRVDGSPLEYNAENPYSPDLLICPPSLAKQIIDAVRSDKAGDDAEDV